MAQYRYQLMEDELCALLGEELGGDGAMDAMIARLAARFGIDESELIMDGGQVEQVAVQAEDLH